MKVTYFLFVVLMTVLLFHGCDNKNGNDPEPTSPTRVETIKDLLDQGTSIAELINDGYTIGELIEAEVSINELLDAGVSVSMLKAEGVSATDLYEAGIGIADLLAAGFVRDELDGLQGEVSDSEGNIYKTVVIGDQIWMADNLKSAHYANGDLIKDTESLYQDLKDEQDPKYKWMYKGMQDNVEVYGYLYTWYVIIDERGVCPTGWQVPNEDEWDELKEYLGGFTIAGGKMKSTSNKWLSPNKGATNESGFTGLPGGIRYADGNPFYEGTLGYWWSYTERNNEEAYTTYLHYGNAQAQKEISTDKKDGLSVRCIKNL